MRNTKSNLTVRFTTKEKGMIAAAAAKEGRSSANYIQNLVLREVEKALSKEKA